MAGTTTKFLVSDCDFINKTVTGVPMWEEDLDCDVCVTIPVTRVKDSIKKTPKLTCPGKALLTEIGRSVHT